MIIQHNGKRYVPAKWMASHWNCSYSSVYKWLKEGIVNGAIRYQRHWYVPEDAKCPIVPDEHRAGPKLGNATYKHITSPEEYERWCNNIEYYGENYQKAFLEV